MSNKMHNNAAAWTRRALRLVGVLSAGAVTLVLAGCFTAFTPKRSYCTHDPKDTDVPRCEVVRAQPG